RLRRQSHSYKQGSNGESFPHFVPRLGGSWWGGPPGPRSAPRPAFARHLSGGPEAGRGRPAQAKARPTRSSFLNSSTSQFLNSPAIRSADRNVSATNVSVPLVHPPVGRVGEPTTNKFS